MNGERVRRLLDWRLFTAFTGALIAMTLCSTLVFVIHDNQARGRRLEHLVRVLDEDRRTTAAARKTAQAERDRQSAVIEDLIAVLKRSGVSFRPSDFGAGTVPAPR